MTVELTPHFEYRSESFTGVGRDGQPDLGSLTGLLGEYQTQILAGNADSFRSRLGQDHPDQMMVALAGMGDMVGAAQSPAHPLSQVFDCAALLAKRQVPPHRAGDIGQHHREHFLVPIGASQLQVGRLEHRPGIAESGLVVDIILRFELVEGGLDLLACPSAAEAKTEVSENPGGDLPAQRGQAQQADRGDAEGEIAERSEKTDCEPSLGPEEQEARKHGNEEQGGGHLDLVDSARNRHQGNQGDEDQAGEEEKIAGAGKSHAKGAEDRIESVPVLVRLRFALIALFGVLLIPITLSSMRGLTHIVSCASGISKPFEVTFHDDGSPLLTGSSVVEAGIDPVCRALRSNLSMRAAGPNRLEVTVPITNDGGEPWQGTVALLVGTVEIPVRIGLVPPGETRAETLVLNLPPGVTGFSGELLIGP